MNTNLIIPIIIWVVLIGLVLFFVIGGRKNKKKYAGRSMEITRDWYEKSQSKYSGDTAKKAYFFTYDKNYVTQGHLMMDRGRKTVYEAKILYGDIKNGYETDMTNHLIHYQHHHNIGAVVTTEASDGGFGITLNSTFQFDGVSIWKYLRSLGYEYHFVFHGLAYRVDVTRAGAAVGSIYSSNHGKNLFESNGAIEPKLGGAGDFVVECADRDIDGMFLLAMAFARTEFSAQNMK